jgi:quinoprotein glucose dehydrogenase
LVYWAGDAGTPPRLFVGCGAWVYALDPATGLSVAAFGESGRAAMAQGTTAAGVIYRDVLVMPGLEGDIYGFDVRTGARRWTFHTIPKPGEYGSDTWEGEDRDGAHCWGGLSLDEERGLVFASIGAPRPDFIGVGRKGDNLFSNCLVAIDALTGERRWHFQNVRHDLWDLDNPAPPNLVVVDRAGLKVAAVAAVTKTGATLLLDRVTGQPLFPFRLRRAPASTLPGETAAEYQPDPELPEPFSRPDFRMSDVTDLSPEAAAYVSGQVARASFGWFMPFTEGRPTLFRSSRGGAQWTGAAVDPHRGLLYVNSNHLLSSVTIVRNDELERDPRFPPSAGERTYQQWCAACHGPTRRGVGMAPSLLGLRHRITDAEIVHVIGSGRGAMPPMPAVPSGEIPALIDYLMRRNQPPTVRPAAGSSIASRHSDYIATGYLFVRDAEGYPGVKPPWGTLSCLDLNTGRIRWQVPLGHYEELLRRGLPPTGTENFGGPTLTAGDLVFCAGTPDRLIRAFDATDGRELWSAPLPWGGYAPPAVYMAKGRQFVVIAATGGGKLGGETGDAYVAFALPANHARPPPVDNALPANP